MSIIGLASLHGAPGVTTLAAALAARLHHRGEDTLLVEADPDGGVLAARYRLSLSPTLTELAGSARRSVSCADARRHAQRIGPHLPVVVAHPAAEQTSAALRTCAQQLVPVLAEDDIRAVVDLGRWRPGSPAAPFIDHADPVFLVIRPTLDQVVQVLHAIDGFLDRTRVRLVLVGEVPYTASQIAEVTGLEVAAILPADERSPDPFAPVRRRHSAWSSAIEQLATRVARSAGGHERTERVDQTPIVVDPVVERSGHP